MRIWVLIALLFTGTAHAKLVTFEMTGLTGCWLHGCFGFEDATGLDPMEMNHEFKYAFTVDDEVVVPVSPDNYTVYNFTTGMTITIDGVFSQFFQNFELSIMRMSVFAGDVIKIRGNNGTFGATATIGACGDAFCNPAWGYQRVFTDYTVAELVKAPMNLFRFMGGDDSWSGPSFSLESRSTGLRIVPEPAAFLLALLAAAAMLTQLRFMRVAQRRSN